jgi:hypothetical protein
MEQEVLVLMVWSMTSVQVGRALGISDVAVRKRCLTMGLSKPPRGFWAKAYAGYPVETLIPVAVQEVLERHGYAGDFAAWRGRCPWIHSDDPFRVVKGVVRDLELRVA